jgi:hypothetical protein
LVLCICPEALSKVRNVLIIGLLYKMALMSQNECLLSSAASAAKAAIDAHPISFKSSLRYAMVPTHEAPKPRASINPRIGCVVSGLGLSELGCLRLPTKMNSETRQMSGLSILNTSRTELPHCSLPYVRISFRKAFTVR